jgi:diaminopimelate epimerase
MTLVFSKMHGAGNDFVVLDATRAPLALDAARIRQLADRRYGIGCDQVLVVEPPGAPGVDFDYRIFNADGSEVGQCGNGARCLARFVREEGLSDAERLHVRTQSRVLALEHAADGQIRVNLGVPALAPEDIPLRLPAAERYTVAVPGHGEVVFSALSMGNPHAVIRVEAVDAAPVATLGPALQALAVFPESVNVGFLQVIGPDQLRLRVYERGAGETLACGSGACAAVVAGRQAGWLTADRVKVGVPGGILQVAWAGPGQPVWLEGPAVTVFKGAWRD